MPIFLGQSFAYIIFIFLRDLKAFFYYFPHCPIEIYHDVQTIIGIKIAPPEIDILYCMNLYNNSFSNIFYKKHTRPKAFYSLKLIKKITNLHLFKVSNNCRLLCICTSLGSVKWRKNQIGCPDSFHHPSKM